MIINNICSGKSDCDLRATGRKTSSEEGSTQEQSASQDNMIIWAEKRPPGRLVEGRVKGVGSREGRVSLLLNQGSAISIILNVIQGFMRRIEMHSVVLSYAIKGFQ